MSKHTGTVDIEIDGKTLKLFYGYDEITEIIEKFGEKMLESILKSKPMEIAELLSIGLKKNHEDFYTKEKIIELSPPMRPAMDAIDKALAYSYFGVKGTEDIENAIKGGDPKKKEIAK